MASDTMAAGSLGGVTGGGNAGEAERLPWLEAVEDEDDAQGPSAAKLIGALLVGLAAIAIVIFAFFQVRGGSGEPQEIVAESGAYKEIPDEVGGLKVEGEGDTAFAASEGADPNARIDLDAIPEAPVAGAQGVRPAEQLAVRAPSADTPPAPAPMAAPRAEAVVQPAAPVVGGPAVQLGAFSSNAAAQAAWRSMSARFASLKPLTNAVVAASVNGRTVYRLRANVASREEGVLLCNKLTIAGESCVVVA